MKVTAFVSHEDCPRHDTGWNHPDHQGRLPAIARAVYRDMLTLFDPLLELSATPATVDDLTLVHDAGYLARIRDTAQLAEREGRVQELDGVPVSGPTWEAVLAAAGGALTATGAVLQGEVRNAFVLARPPGRDALPARGGGASLVNTVAVAARHLRVRRGVGRVLVLSWGTEPPDALGTCLAGDAGIALASVHQARDRPADGFRGPRAELPAGSGADALREATRAVLEEAGPADFILLAAGFDLLADDPAGALAVEPDGIHEVTVALREWADARAGGRLVSVLEGGSAASATGRAVVQHLRALAGLPAA